MIPLTGKYTSAKIMIDDVEESAMAQIVSFLNHPAFTEPVAIMSDVHAGKGSVIGFTMPLTAKVIPNIVGVDIGCGVVSVNIGKTLPLSLDLIDHKIRQNIPFGTDIHAKPVLNMEKEFPWRQATVLAQKFSVAYRGRFGETEAVDYTMDWFLEKCGAIRDKGIHRFLNSFGTLGGGNHFIELGLSDLGDYWLTVHTGSRNFGKCVCEYWQNKARKFVQVDRRNDIQAEIERMKREITDGKALFHRIKEFKAQVKLGVDTGQTEWLEGQNAAGYLYDMIFSQVYAEVNRKHILKIVYDILGLQPVDSIESVHNYIDFRDFIIRKGAIRSYEGERFILPFNMRDGILICTGRSAPDWNFSAPHGAGRLMGRSHAKKTLSLEEFKTQMQGIYSTSVGPGTLDESPMAYKDSRVIEEAIGPTAAVIGRIKPVLSMKGSEED